MTEPEFDAEGYPTRETLKAISEWPRDDFLNMLAFCKKAWEYGNAAVTVKDREWSFSTMGKSGNESIIQAMQENEFFWFVFWKSSERGGHYKFEPVY